MRPVEARLGIVLERIRLWIQDNHVVELCMAIIPAEEKNKGNRMVRVREKKREEPTHDFPERKEWRSSKTGRARGEEERKNIPGILDEDLPHIVDRLETTVENNMETAFCVMSRERRGVVTKKGHREIQRGTRQRDT